LLSPSDRHLPVIIAIIAAAAVLLIFGCSSSVQQEAVTTQPPAVQSQAAKDLELIDSQGNDYFVWKYQGRIYVIGNSKTNEAFKSQHHLPYTRTILGVGPYGETVIFEVNPKDDALANRLQKTFEQG
jgi:outer membrane biogenesis lipoprotein LolB